MKVLIRYLLSDRKVVERFKPSLEVIRKMNLNELIDKEDTVKG